MPCPTSSDRSRAVLDRALALGFEVAGVADPASVHQAGRGIRTFVELERHGSMGWMADKLDRRCDPRSLWPDVRSVLMVGANYGPATDPMALLDHPDRAIISVYARNKDYHDVLKKRLKALGRWMASTYDAPLKVFVDTAPVMEKPLAAAAGLGWQGKHTNLVSRDFGSWLFLGALFTPLELATSEAVADHCGSCRACLDICPTDAFPAPYQLDARQCLSYLSIEHKGPWPERFRRAMGNRIYGCDDCLAVCPWNKFASLARESHFHARAELQAPALADLVQLDDAAFRQIFAGSPIKRIGRNRFIRNVLYAIGNSQDAKLISAAGRLIDDADPVVSDAARWAVDQLSQ